LQTTESQISYQELERRRDASSVLLLREMQETEDLRLKRELFEQAADQESSHISEALNGKVSTRFDFDARGGKLYFLQPGGVTDWYEMHHNGYARAKALAENDPQLAFYRRISKAELENAATQEELLKTGEPFAMVELSLAGDDLAPREALKKVGRDPELRRAFLRVSVSDGQKFSIYSESLDGVTVEDGRDIASGWGLWQNSKMSLEPNASSVDILANPIILKQDELNLEHMHTLAERLVQAYDDRLQAKTGQTYRSGRSPEQALRTYEFVLNNPDLMNAHMEGLCHLAGSNFDLKVLADYANDLRYDIMASYKQRMEGKWIDKGNLAESVAGAGASERAVGTEFYGCDTTVGSNNIANGGYANSEGKSLMELSGKKIQCANSDCKKKVVVPDSDLIEGKLTCSECGLQYDVCTGTSKFKKVSRPEKPEVKQESPLTKWNREYELNKTQKKLEKLRLAEEAKLANSA